MLGRFGVGLVRGLLVGSLVLAGLVLGLKMLAVPVWAAYLLAMAGGALTGLIAGKEVDKVTLTEIATIKAGENEKADQYEYKGDCQQAAARRAGVTPSAGPSPLLPPEQPVCRSRRPSPRRSRRAPPASSRLSPT